MECARNNDRHVDRLTFSTLHRWTCLCEIQLRNCNNFSQHNDGGLAQMVERPLSMREVRGSMPRFSNILIFFCLFFSFFLVLFFNKSIILSRPGIEPGSQAWQAWIIPLNQRDSYMWWGHAVNVASIALCICRLASLKQQKVIAILTASQCIALHCCTKVLLI